MIKEKLENWWTAFSAEKRNRIILLLLGLGWFIYLFSTVLKIPLYCFIGLIFLLITLYSYQKSWSLYTFLVAVFFYFYSSPLTMVLIGFILVLLLVYIIYKLLDRHRINRITKIAHMTSSQLSGVRYEKPEVEIVIRGGGRK